MATKARTRVEMRDFPGLITDADPRDLAQGAAQRQVNVICLPGKLEVRPGVRRLQFEDEGEVVSP